MKKILIIEDESVVRNNIAELFESSGYCVIPASGGFEALELLKTDIPDIIVSDINMPGMNGYELINHIRGNEITSAIPFIFLTAKTEMSDLRKGMNHGADDYIIKPFDAVDLLKSVELRLEKQEKAENDINKLRDSITRYIPHELRTPLVAISGYSDLILEDYYSLSSSEIYDLVAKIKDGHLRLHKTIEKFILYSELVILSNDRIQLQQLKEQFCSKANYVITHNVTNKADEWKRTNDITIGLEECNLIIPEVYLSTLISEITDNALKFSFEGDPVSVTGYNDKGYYILKIKDTGRGISQEDIHRINAFVQFDREQYQQSGNGLGLIISKMLTELFGGELSVVSEQWSYTEVTIKMKTNNMEV